jgi:hypothetical protein
MICTLVGTPIGAANAQEDGQAQLDATASAMLALKSFHFKLETIDGKTVFQDAFELKIVEGDVVRPANFQADLDVKLAIVDLTLEVVSFDGNIWVKNPIGGGDTFIQVVGGDSDFQLPPMDFLNPDRLVQESLKYLDDPQISGTEELDGQEMTVLTGTFDPSQLIASGTPSAGDDMITAASEPLDVKMWIDDQDRLVQIDFVGPLFSFEEGSGVLVRRIAFSNFDGEITIEPPA